MKHVAFAIATGAALGAFSLVACGGDTTAVVTSPGAASAVVAAAAQPGQAAKTPAAVASAAPTASGPPPPRLEYTEADFAATEQSRDPFRSYPEIFLTQRESSAPVAHQRNVAADRFSLDELKLVAIVTGGVAPRAMFVDPQGKGWVVQRGEFLGHAETVRQAGPGAREYALNWRVDRIRDTDVVFVRDDPTKSNAVGSTRVIAMRVDADPDATSPRR